MDYVLNIIIKPTEVDVLLRDSMYMQLPSIYGVIDSSAIPSLSPIFKQQKFFWGTTKQDNC